MPRSKSRSNFENRKNEIVDLAAHEFAIRGYASTSMADLERVVRLGRGAMYHYIGSKENLLVEVQARVLVPLQEGAQAIFAIDADPVIRLRLLSELLMTMILHRLDHIWAYEQDYRHLKGAKLKRLLQQRKEFEEVVTALMIEAMDAGTFRCVDPRLAMLQFLNLHNHTYIWVNPTGPWTAEELSREYFTTLLLGIKDPSCDAPDPDGDHARIRQAHLVPLLEQIKSSTVESSGLNGESRV